MSKENHVWPCLSYPDARAAIKFLVEALGFEETAVYDGAAPGEVSQAELRWPPGGGVMLGSVRPPGHDLALPAGVGNVYLVTEQPDALFERAVGAGAMVVRPLSDEDYGSRGFTVRDPQGVLWSVGTYKGA